MSVRLSAATLDSLPASVQRPHYDRSGVEVGIVHFGVGGFHRAHQAVYLDELFSQGLALDWGICGVGLLAPDEAMHRALSGQDGLYTVLTRDPDGSVGARVVGSMVRYLFAPSDPDAVLDQLTAAGTRIVSLTITEGGYLIDPQTGCFQADEAQRADGVSGPPNTAFGYLLEALRRRRAAGAEAFTVLSCDNLPGNGAAARCSLVELARLRDPELAEWIGREVSFPNSMVDRITPVTTPADRAELLERYGIEDAWPVVCEPFSQWVIEDDFGAGRPPLERVGAELTDDVTPYELMKLRLLNVGHQALGYAGRLAGYTYVHEAVSDPALAAFLRGYLSAEGQPTLPPLPTVDLDAYIDSLLERFGNRAIADTLARLCESSSDRIPKWLLPVIRINLDSGRSCERSAAIVAAWARYCQGADDHGAPLELRDQRAEQLRARAAEQDEDPLAFVENTELFGDLAQRAGFTQPYRRALESLAAVGVQRTLARLG
ncbi:MAG: mannitol dehydrogenase [Frankiales bacterium]|nr:mannitol dehydrogenase [Frankiales bacterium]